MTDQEVFDTVARHLLTQGRKSYLTTEQKESMKQRYMLHDTTILVCAYRGADGCKCAAGVLIPDGSYSVEMEGCNVSENIVSRALPTFSLGFVATLQRIHDHSPVETWWDWLKVCADRNNLSTGVLDALPIN